MGQDLMWFEFLTCTKGENNQAFLSACPYVGRRRRRRVGLKKPSKSQTSKTGVRHFITIEKIITVLGLLVLIISDLLSAYSRL